MNKILITLLLMTISISGIAQKRKQTPSRVSSTTSAESLLPMITCEDCNGKGMMDCPVCGGSCDDDGYDCKNCGGSGILMISGAFTRYINNNGKTASGKVKCTTCNRRGKYRAPVSEANHYGVKAYEKEQYTKAAQLFKLAAQNGDTDGMCNYAECCRDGEGVKQNYTEAFKYFNMAADQGHNRAKLSVGDCYLNAQGVEQNYDKAMKYYMMVHEDCVAEAMYRIGYMYEKGYGVNLSKNDAIEWYKNSYEKGYDEAKRKLILFGVMRDDEGRLYEDSCLVEETPIVNDQVYDVVDQMPSFPGGQGGLMQFLSNNVIYPDVALKYGIEGRVTVEFIVEADGSVSNTKILRSVAPSLDKEAMRVVGSMPKWTPGKMNGAPVRVKYFVPIVFKK